MGDFFVSGLVKVLCVFSLLIASINVVYAGSFKVFPLKLDLNQKSKTTLFKITNTGKSEVIIQLETVKWQQDENGEDLYEPTTDIVYFPKILKIAVGEQRLIRIGYRAGKAGVSEKTYRIFAQELPQLGKQSSALKFSLRFSVPIFVYSFKSEPRAEISSSDITNGYLNVFLKNSGDKHFVVKSIFVTGLRESGQEMFNAVSGGWYVLPGNTKSFSVKLPENECQRSDKVLYKVETTATDFEKILPIPDNSCGVVIEKSNPRKITH